MGMLTVEALLVVGHKSRSAMMRGRIAYSRSFPGVVGHSQIGTASFFFFLFFFQIKMTEDGEESEISHYIWLGSRCAMGHV